MRKTEKTPKPTPEAAGKSSFNLIDEKRFLNFIDTDSVSSFIDLGCGAGNYTIKIAEMLGKSRIWAVDLWKEGIELLKKRSEELNIKNVNAIVADIRKRLPFEDESFDASLIATVIHHFNKSKRIEILKEVARITKTGGMLYIVEFKKITEGPGPAFDIRIDERELGNTVQSCGFKTISFGDIGQFNYTMKFRKIV